MANIIRKFFRAASYVTCLPLERGSRAADKTSCHGKDTFGTEDRVSCEFGEEETLTAFFDNPNFGSESDLNPLSGLSKYLPAVGIMIGLILAGINYALLSISAPKLVAAFILATIWLLLTNGLHFDGLMDTADGIFSHRTKERMLEIMADSRVGNFGAMTGFIVFSSKVICLSALSGKVLMCALVLIPAWARFCELFAIGSFPYAKPEGKGKIWHDTTRVPRDLVIGAAAPLSAALAIFVLGFQAALLVSLSTLVFGAAAAICLNRKLGGHTGDTYGATVEISEAGALLALALIVR